MSADQDAQKVRRAALDLMDAADLLEERREADARARAQNVVHALNLVFWPELADEDDEPDTLH